MAVVFVTVFLDLVGFGIVIPLLPLYAESFGAGPFTVMWLVAVYSLMQFFFAPAWGRLSDRVGRRPVLLVGLFGSAASYLLFGLAGSLAMLFVARALNGVMGANVGVAQAYVADLTAPEDRARGMGMVGAAFALGFIFGPAIGGALAQFGPAAPFLGAGALAAANGVVAVFRLPESLPPAARGRATAERRPGLTDRLRFLVRGSDPSLRNLYAVGFLFTLAMAAMEATLPLWASRRWALTPAGIAFFFAYLGTVAAIAHGLVVGRLVRRVGERRAALYGLATLAVGLALIPFAPNLPLLGVALALFALGQGAAMPAVSALVSRRGGAGEQGTLLGAQQSVSALGRVVGPQLGGAAFAFVGIGAPYLAGAALTLAALGVLAVGAAGREAAA